MKMILVVFKVTMFKLCTMSDRNIQTKYNNNRIHRTSRRGNSASLKTRYLEKKCITNIRVCCAYLGASLFSDKELCW